MAALVVIGFQITMQVTTALDLPISSELQALIKPCGAKLPQTDTLPHTNMETHIAPL